MTYQPTNQSDSTWQEFDPNKPPSKGAYRHPEGGWVLPSTDKSGRVFIDRELSTDGVDTMAYAKLLLLIAERLHREGRLDELLGVEPDKPDDKAA